MAHIVTFGEIMLRLTPSRPKDMLISAPSLDRSYAGAESNVASSLAHLGNHAYFVTSFPDNALGRGALMSLGSHGVDTRYVKWGEFRMGTYFIEQGASIRSSEVLYDRENSTFQRMSVDDFDWKEILKDKDWLHLTGITPSLSGNCAQACIDAAREAGELGLKVSFDLNYRRKMWKTSGDARSVFTKIFENTDVLIANEGSIKDVFGWENAGDVRQLMLRAGEELHMKSIAFTDRGKMSASGTQWQGYLLHDGKYYTSKCYDLEIVDRFGTGDAFVAGLIHGYGKNWPMDKIIGFAAATSAIKHTIPGDVNTSDEATVLEIMENNSYGHIKR